MRSLPALSAPASVFLELTYRCPGSCPGCPSRRARKGREEMSAEQWREVIASLPAGIEEIRLTGGEPTLHPGFGDIVRALEARGRPFRLFTNGMWPAGGRVLKALGRAGHLREVQVSLHGSTAAVHETFTGLVDFASILAAIKGARAAGLHVTTSSVIGLFNTKDLGNLARLAKEAGSQMHHFVRYIGPLKDRVSIYREDLKGLLATLAAVRDSPLPLALGGCYPDCYIPGLSRCRAGFTSLVISPYGEVRPCPFLDESLGDLGRHSLDEIWRGRLFRAWRVEVPPDCLGCRALERCLGGCRAVRRNFLFKRDPLMEEPLSSDAPLPSVPSWTPDAIPLFDGVVRDEPFGCALIVGGDALPARDGVRALVALCDGTRRAGEIERQAGPGGAAFLKSLVARGFLRV